MNLATIRAQPSRASAWAVVRAPASARPVAAASRARSPVRAWRSRATKAARCRCYRRLPKRGFNKPNRKEFAVINLGLIQKFIDDGKIDTKVEITEDVLVASGLVRRKLDGIRILAKGEIKAKAKFTVTGASKGAVEAVEKAGGSLTITSATAAE